MKGILLALIRGYQYLFRPMLRRQLPVCAELFRLRRGSGDETRRTEGDAACRTARPALSPVSSGRIRPGPLIGFWSSLSRAASTAARGHPGCHGYPTSHPVCRFFVLRADVVGGVAEGVASAAGGRDGPDARAGGDRPASGAGVGAGGVLRAAPAVPGAPPSGARWPRAGPPRVSSQSRPISIARKSTRPAARSRRSPSSSIAIRSTRRSPTWRCSGRPSAPSSRRRGCSARACRTTAPSITALPGPRELAPGADQVELRLQAVAANGDKIVQVLTFHRGSYVIDVAYDITNNTTAPRSRRLRISS